MFQVVSSGLLGRHVFSCAGTSGCRKSCRFKCSSARRTWPVLTPEEEFDLFGPPDDSGAASAVQIPVAKAAAPLPGITYVGPSCRGS